MIYLDNNATTRTADDVLTAMQPYYREYYGNPHSAHHLGRRAMEGIEHARTQVGDLLGVSPKEITFTSCGTESNAIVLRGYRRKGRRKVVTTAVEHPSVLAVLQRCASAGEIDLVVIPVAPSGELDMNALEAAIDSKTLLVSVMLAQNETGVIHPIPEIAEITRERGVALHVDAVQAAGKIPLDVYKMGADFLTISGHKFHAPKGIGALFIREGFHVDPLWNGAGQEGGLRPGTEAVPGIIGLGIAAKIARERLSEQEWVRHLRDQLERGLLLACPFATANGASQPRLPNTLSVSFAGLFADEIVEALDERGVCVSAGAACHSGVREPSNVMKAMAKPLSQALGTIRFSLSRFTTATEIDTTVERVVAATGALTNGGRAREAAR
ncbi:MAG: cysteine desulfurase family protein [Thermoanaerobaculia bacterium]